MLCNALLMGKKAPKTAPSPWGFVTLPEEDRAMAIGNMHNKFVRKLRKVRQCLKILLLLHHDTTISRCPTGLTYQGISFGN